MRATKELVEKLIAKYKREGTLAENKEELMNKIDLFLLMNRLTGDEYKQLKEEIGE